MSIRFRECFRAAMRRKLLGFLSHKISNDAPVNEQHCDVNIIKSTHRCIPVYREVLVREIRSDKVGVNFAKTPSENTHTHTYIV